MSYGISKIYQDIISVDYPDNITIYLVCGKYICGKSVTIKSQMKFVDK